MSATRHRNRGFTLIELMVALFITAIIFAMGYGAVNQALNDHDFLKTRQARLTAVETAMRVLVQDFSQLAPRPVRDIVGTGMLPCLLANPNGTLLGNDSTTLSSTGSSVSLGSTALSSTSRREAVVAGVCASPAISNAGPATPPAATAPASQPSSLEPSGTSAAPFRPILPKRRRTATPSPAPQ